MVAPSAGEHEDFFDSDFEEEVTHDAEDLLGHNAPPKDDTPDSLPSPTGVVIVYLEALKERLTREMKDGSWPKCYVQGQFWIHPPDPYIAMHKAARSPGGLCPDSLYHPSVFLWLPHLLDNTPYLCPMPMCQNHQTSTAPLTIKGWNDNPIARRIVTLDGVYYIMTKHIQCDARAGGCGKSWNLYNSVILEQMDPGLAAAFPAFLTH